MKRRGGQWRKGGGLEKGGLIWVVSYIQQGCPQLSSNGILLILGVLGNIQIIRNTV